MMVKFSPFSIGPERSHSNLGTIRPHIWRGNYGYKEDIFPHVMFLVLASTFLTCIAAVSGIIEEQMPNMIATPDDLASQSFHGNQSHVDYFRLLQRDGNSLLIGARNYVYNISMYDLSENMDRRIEWMSKKLDSAVCFTKGKSEGECHNYIRVLAKKSDGEFLVCGTNAYKPTCRDYSLLENGTFVFEESPGVGKSPFDPRHNSTFVFAEGHLYAGTVVDFQGMMPLIYRDPLKTDFSDYRQLNGPDFVHSFEYGDYVFFFFRETAVEYMNCGKRVYSRVARVCKGDRGVEQQRSNGMSTWTSFLKSRLNCSFPGDYPFYFDEIQSVSDVVLGIYFGSNNEVIYAIFTTPQNSIPGSAVCAFSMRDILDVFESPFKEQKDLNSNWLPVPQHKVPEPRPGTCVNDSRTLPRETVNFVKLHPLMDELVSPFMGKPLLMKATFKYRFTKLTVDPQVPISNGDFVDVVFIATDIGMILKVINAPAEPSDRQVSPIVIEEIYTFEPPVSINNLQIAKQKGRVSKLIVITDMEVKAIPLERCQRALFCRECIGLQDPYCAWYPDTGLCESTQKNLGEKNYLQNVTSGVHLRCPDNFETSTTKSPPSDQIYDTEVIELPTERNVEKEIDGSHRHETKYINNVPAIPHVTRGRAQPPRRGGKELLATTKAQRELNEVAIAYSEGVTGPVVGASLGGPLIYSAETLAIAVTTACVAALVIGFISGFLFSRKCRGDDYPHFSDTPYLDSKLNKCENTADPNMYTANNTSLAPPKQINNRVTNYNPKNINKSNATNTCTTADTKLIKPAKCAYI